MKYQSRYSYPFDLVVSGRYVVAILSKEALGESIPDTETYAREKDEDMDDTIGDAVHERKRNGRVW